MNWPWRRVRLPQELRQGLRADERILVAAAVNGSDLLAASRFGLWSVSDGTVTHWGWELISKATLADRTLTLTVASVLQQRPGDWTVVRDLPPQQFRLERPSRLTDLVHARVRRSVAASRYLPGPAGGGWVALRRVPGRDGVQPQLRLDPGALADELFAAAERIAQEIAPPAAVESD